MQAELKRKLLDATRADKEAYEAGIHWAGVRRRDSLIIEPMRIEALAAPDYAVFRKPDRYINESEYPAQWDVVVLRNDDYTVEWLQDPPDVDTHPNRSGEAMEALFKLRD